MPRSPKGTRVLYSIGLLLRKTRDPEDVTPVLSDSNLIVMLKTRTVMSSANKREKINSEQQDPESNGREQSEKKPQKQRRRKSTPLYPESPTLWFCAGYMGVL